MSLLGQAALAMWWDMAKDVNAEFQDWHSHEHFRERLSIAGFMRATRWQSASGGEGVFQIYELQDHAVLSSPPYLSRLNAPTPWSTKMMPHHRNMVRSQCHVMNSQGAGTARHALVIRVSPAPQAAQRLQHALQLFFEQVVDRSGVVGGHLLRHEAPAIAQTTEQKIRGNDQFADWVVIVVGYDLGALDDLTRQEMSVASLVQMGAQPEVVSGLYALSFSALAGEIP